MKAQLGMSEFNKEKLEAESRVRCLLPCRRCAALVRWRGSLDALLRSRGALAGPAAPNKF